MSISLRPPMTVATASRSVLRCALMTAALLAAAYAGASGIAVQVQDMTGKLLPDVVVYAEPESGAVPKPLRQGTIEQRGLKFEPLVTVVQTGSLISFPNNDKVRHHIYSFSAAHKFDQKLYSGTTAAPQLFDKAGVVVLGCNIHDKMLAYVKIVDTPYFAKTDGSGAARIDIPAAGKYTLKAWHYGVVGGVQTGHQATVGRWRRAGFRPVMGLRVIRFRSLESRIVTLFLVLICIVQVLGLFVIQRGIDSNARSSIAAELNNGAKVFKRLLDQNAQSLRFGARLLARDTAFVAAVGNNDDGDRATIESALANSGRRIKASLTMLIGADRKISASTNGAQSAGLEKLVISMLDQAEQADGANGVAIVERRPYQIVVMPVKAPLTIGWVVMAFPIDRPLASDMREVSSLQATIVTHDAKAGWLAVGSSFLAPSVDSLVAQLQAMPRALGGPFDLNIDGSNYSARLLPIGEDNGQTADVVLARSIDEATAEYAKLERWLVFLTMAGIVISAVASVLTAKRIAQPLTELTVTAKRLEQGDYKSQIDTSRQDEIGALAHAFDSMREGIAKREQEIRRLAYWDTLTNLPNRAQFLLLLNDAMGHSFGDALLRQVAGRLQLLLANRRHSSAQVARLGGDEFAILLPGFDIEQAQAVAADVLRALETPLSMEDQMVDIGAGVGVAGYPDHGADGESLLSMAEVAMYAAKQRN